MSVVASDAARGSVEAALRGRRVDLRGSVFKGLLVLTLLVALVVLVALVWTTWTTAQPVFAERGWDFVRSDVSALASRAGVWQGVVGSLILIAFVAVVALPLGVAAAIYLQEYARDTRLNRLLIANIRNLAGVPSVVFGILGLVVFAQALGFLTGPAVKGSYLSGGLTLVFGILGLVVFVQTLRAVTGPGGGAPGYSYVSGGLTLAVLVMPIVILVTMEALRAVPASIREGAYGVGATRWEVVRSHVLPYAAPGMFTGTILSLARAFGETAPLLLVGAVTGYINTPSGRSPLEILQGPYTALPTLVYSFSKQIGDDWRANAAAAIIVLLVVILVVNAVAILLRNRYERRW
jgi:phosphate transport system permease protein